MNPTHVQAPSTEHMQPQPWTEVCLAQQVFPVHLLGSPLGTAEQAIIALPNRWSDPARFFHLAVSIASSPNTPATAVIGLQPPQWKHFWYPCQEFDAALDRQRPCLDISLGVIEHVLQRLVEHIPIEAITLFGFAEGACLALEYAARNAYPLNAIVAFSGVLLGSSLDTSDRFNLASPTTKMLITASNAQPAGARVRFTQTVQLLKQSGYKVVALTYERRTNTILPEELTMSRNIIYGSINES